MGALSPNAMNVNGTGQTVGALKNSGIDQSSINQLGTSPNVWQNLLKGGAMGAAQGLQNYGNQQQQMRRPMAQPQANAPNPFFYGQGGSNG